MGRTLSIMAALAAALLLFASQSSAAGQSGPEGVREAVKRQVIASLPWNEADVEVTEVETGLYDPAADKYDSIEVRLPKGAGVTGRVPASVTLYKGSAQVKRFWASATVKVYGSAVVALRPLKSNSVIEREDVRLARVEVDSLNDSLGAVDEAVGLRVLRPIPAGGVLRSDQVRREAFVKKGQAVTITADNGRIVVKGRGKAVRDGALGEVVPVKTPSGREVAAKVTGRGELAVNFD